MANGPTMRSIPRVALGLLVASASFASTGFACTLDRSFAGSGFASPPLLADQGSAAAVTRDAQGRYLVAGESNIVVGAARMPGPTPAGNHVHVARYLATGQLDPAFGGIGVSQRSLDAPSGTMLVDAVESDGDGGAFVLLRSLSSLTPGAVLVHANGDGTWDGGFGGPASTEGMVAVGCGAQTTWIMPELLRDELGRLVVAATTETEVSLMRLNEDGTRDATFGTDGCVSHPLLPRAALGLVRRPAGYELAGGTTGEVWTFRVDESGAADTSYGTDGLVVEAMPDVSTAGVALQGDRMLVVVKKSQAAFVARLNTLGRLDSTFGIAGFASLPATFRLDPNWATSIIAVRDDGRIALVGRPAQISGQLGIAMFDAGGSPLGGCSPGAIDYPEGRFDDGERGVVFDGDRLVVVGGSWSVAASRHEPNVLVVDGDALFASGFE